MSSETNNFNDLSPAAMAKKAVDVGVYKASKDPVSSFTLAIFGGVFIAIAFVFYITVVTGSSSMPWGMAKLVGALCFSLGLILCVIMGAELFTSTVLTSTAWASRRITTPQMLRTWVRVYLGNFVGGVFFVWMIWQGKVYMGDSGQWGLTALKIASHKLHHTFFEAFILGVMCNLLVCLAVWMTFSCRSTGDKILAMLFPVAMFVATGFEHSIANMFMIPMGIAIQHFATPEFWAGIGHVPADFAELTVSNFLLKNELPVTLGNIVGGAVFVGLGNWFVFLRNDNKKEAVANGKVRTA
ncbi:formate transporter FocA [Sansalvadorimonas verongulae]|uniref:formate transporter FocA n=1 Tax=Sansalvadorimonas verongulae TaxID=2172824 RepID=UPI0012BD2FFF|nr:formate transporter FocA [Sansalvadorimonas verongulae]MTI15527.1 formate transporter FocA [Sansalvadorimonas verongulae]